MNVKEKFIEITKQTYPHGYEHELIDKLPNCLKSDEFGNLYHQIGLNPTTMFTCHLDTASNDKKEVTHVIKDKMIYTDGSTILGADDKAGVVVLLSLIEANVTGLYYFFLGEERGCIGSKKVSSVHSISPLEHITKVVSFDRRGYDSVITHQMTGRSCSYEFAKELSQKLNDASKDLFETSFKYSPDSTGIYTDSAQFVSIYPECTNISVGYQHEHTKSESQDIEHLEKLCEVVKCIDWDKLNIHRDIKKVDYYDFNNEYDYEYGYSYGSKSYKSSYGEYEQIFEARNQNCITKKTILDTEYYGHETIISYDYNTYEITNIKSPHPARLLKEKLKIDQLLTSLELDFDELKWDGNTLTIQSLNDKDITLSRVDIAEYLVTFNDWIETEIKYNSIS